MAKFLRPSKRSLTNGQHFSLITLFVELIESVNFNEAKIQEALALLRASLAQEDKYMNIAQGSYLTAELQSSDKQRGTCYSVIATIVDQWLRVPVEPMSAAASRLKQKLSIYKLNVRAQYDDESGVMDNLIQEFDEDQASADLATLQLTEVYRQMKLGNGQVKALLRQRDQEIYSVPPNALRLARQETDKAYDNFIQLIEAFDLTLDTDRFSKFIDSWNQTLRRYQEIIDRKTSKKETQSTEAQKEETSAPAPTTEAPEAETPEPTPAETEE